MDVFQEIVRPLSEICTCLLAASHHGVDDGCILGCIVIATEEIVLPADGYRDGSGLNVPPITGTNVPPVAE